MNSCTSNPIYSWKPIPAACSDGLPFFRYAALPVQRDSTRRCSRLLQSRLDLRPSSGPHAVSAVLLLEAAHSQANLPFSSFRELSNEWKEATRTIAPTSVGSWTVFCAGSRQLGVDRLRKAIRPTSKELWQQVQLESSCKQYLCEASSVAC